MRHYLFTFLAFSTLLLPQEVFLDKAWQKAKGILSETKEYCHPLPTKDVTFCQTTSFAYPIFTDVPHKNIAKIITDMMKKRQSKFAQESLINDTLKEISDSNYQPTGNYSSSEKYDLFVITPETFTIENENSGYSGGAHGFNSILYENYSRSGKKIVFDTLFVVDYNASLHTIAEKIYKKSVGLKANESLQNDGWFDDKFILTPNVAITPRGLLFHYNSYEIKAYASGHTRFLLPYEAIRSLINPEGALKSYLSVPTELSTQFNEAEVAQLSLHIQRVGKDKVKIRIQENIDIYSTQNWLSLSFPQLKEKQSVKVLKTVGFKSTRIYPAESKVYHRGYKKAVKSKYLLIEGEGKSGYSEMPKEIELLVTLKEPFKKLDVRIRGTFKNKKEEKTIPSRYDGVKGQQGYTNYEVSLPLH